MENDTMLLIAHSRVDSTNIEKEKRVSDLVVANIELLFRKKATERRIAELVNINKELVLENQENERRSAELTLARKFIDSNLYALLNNTKDLMWTVDRNFNLITSNLPFDRAVEASSGKAIAPGDSIFSDRYPQEMVARYRKVYERAISGEAFSEIDYFDFPIESWTETSYCPIREGEMILGIACHSRDITFKRQAEQQILESESRLKEAQTIARISNWQIDLASNTHDWSDEFYKIHGLDIGELQPSAEAFLSLVHPEDRDLIEQKMLKSIETRTSAAIDFRFIAKDGTEKHGYSEWRIEVNGNNTPVRVYGILQDNTEKKNAELEREKLIADTVKRNRDLEQFTFIISHNLRAPTANIVGLAEILLTGGLTEQEKKECLAAISVSATGLDTIIKDINHILQVKQQINDKRELIAFSELLNEITSSSGSLIKSRDVLITHDFSEIDEIYSVRVYLYSILHNLLSNSIKYSIPDVQPRIEIKSKKLNGKTILTFQDNGIGMNMKEVGSKIFGLYRRFHSHVEGKGMGLFMVKTQVEAIGGTISVVSEVNKGTEFTIVFNS